jgi:hypothetical protein
LEISWRFLGGFLEVPWHSAVVVVVVVVDGLENRGIDEQQEGTRQLNWKDKIDAQKMTDSLPFSDRLILLTPPHTPYEYLSIFTPTAYATF